jgi:hypothetical protein
MSELKCEKTQVIKVEYGDLEDFIEEVYGHKHEIVAAEEVSNYTTLSFAEIGEHPEDYDEFEREEFTEWHESGKFWRCGTRNILEALCLAGHIESGDYFVSIYW